MLLALSCACLARDPRSHLNRGTTYTTIRCIPLSSPRRFARGFHPERDFFILNTLDAFTILRSYDTLPAALLPAGFLLAFHDAYGARGVATGRIRRFVEAFEYRRYLDVQVTPGHEPRVPEDADAYREWQQARRSIDVQCIADLLSWEPVSRQYGYYGAEKRKWYMSADQIVQRLLYEGYAWVDHQKVRDAIALRKSLVSAESARFSRQKG